MTKKVAVVLSGCGVYDGSEIYESVLTLQRLDEQDCAVGCFAPATPQMHVIDHRSGEPREGEQRNTLQEAARLARGDIEDLAQARAEAWDALVVPGGYGVVKNLCDFAQRGARCQVEENFLRFAQEMHRLGKPIGLICIAPVMAPAIFGAGVRCTVGDDEETARAIEEMGGRHEPCAVDQICVDRERKLVTTPAYMLAGRIREAQQGIQRLVDEVLAMA